MGKQKVVSISGGRTSGFLSMLMKEQDPEAKYLFMDTGAEHPDTYTFLRDCNDYFDLGITVLRGDFSAPLGAGVSYAVIDIKDAKPDLIPYKEMMRKYGIPYIGGMFCTDRMKLKPFKKYCDDTFGKGQYEPWLGIRIDEPKRYFDSRVVRMFPDFEDEDFKRLFENLRASNEFGGLIDIWDGMWSDAKTCDVHDRKAEVEQVVESAFSRKTGNNLHYLFEISDATKEDINDFWKTMPFDLGINEWLGNCVFCPKKSDLKLGAASRDEPEMLSGFLSALHDGSVRVGEGAGNADQMYRGKRSLEALISQFDGIDTAKIKQRIRGSHMEDSGSCSESCEVFLSDE